MLNIEIKTVPAKKMRYPTAGDYWEKRNKVFFRIVQLPDWRYEALIAIHELVEYVLVKAAGIKVSDIDEFDMNFEAEREMGMHPDHEEPGDAPDSPYHIQHAAATVAERCAAAIMFVSWQEYDNCLAGMVYPKMSRRRR